MTSKMETVSLYCVWIRVGVSFILWCRSPQVFLEHSQMVFCYILLSILVGFTSKWHFAQKNLSILFHCDCFGLFSFSLFFPFCISLVHVRPRVGTNEFSVSLYYKYLLSTHKKLSIKW